MNEMLLKLNLTLDRVLFCICMLVLQFISILVYCGVVKFWEISE